MKMPAGKRKRQQALAMLASLFAEEEAYFSLISL
jgi:hypothetical protein